MNITNENETIRILNGSLSLQQYQAKFLYNQVESTRSPTPRLPLQPHKPLSCSQIIEICSLCFILVEHTIIFILTFRKKKSKITLFDTK
jgi:hypothetical protein